MTEQLELPMFDSYIGRTFHNIDDEKNNLVTVLRREITNKLARLSRIEVSELMEASLEDMRLIEKGVLGGFGINGLQTMLKNLRGEINGH